MKFPFRPWAYLQFLVTLRGNHMSEHVEKANKWVYFVQNVGWVLAIPVAVTLIYSNLSNRVEAQEREITDLRSQITDISSRLDAIDQKQQQQLVLMTEIKTIVESNTGRSLNQPGTTYGHAASN